MGRASHAALVRGGVAHEDMSDLVLRRTVDPPHSMLLGDVVGAVLDDRGEERSGAVEVPVVG